MQTTVVPRTAYRPQIRRVSQRELELSRTSTDFNASNLPSGNRWPSTTHSQAGREMSNPWRPTEQPRRNPLDDDKNKCFTHRGWIWLFGAVFCLILIIAIIAIVLGIVLPTTLTTAATDSNATPKMFFVNSGFFAPLMCSSDNRGSIAYLNETTSSNWTSYSYNYTAVETAPTLVFAFETTTAHVYYLDDVSVVDVSTPSVELLTDPSFENTTGWTQSCGTTCTSEVASGAQCSGSSGNCLMVSCPNGNSSIFLLSQSFVAIAGNTYTISFMFNYLVNCSTDIMSFYLDII